MSNDQRQAIQLPFPLRGIDENWAFDKQPEGTASAALNVRPFDAIDHRLRGGQRDGLSKYLTAAVNGSNHIQMLDQVTLALNPNDVEADTLLLDEQFTYADTSLLHVVSADWDGYDGSNVDPFASPEGATDGLQINSGAMDTVVHVDGTIHVAMNNACATGEKFIIKWTTEKTAPDGFIYLYVFLRCAPPAQEGYWLQFKITDAADTTIEWSLYRMSGGGVFVVNGDTLTIPGGKTAANVLTWEMRVSGSRAALYCDDTLIKEDMNVSADTANTRVGIGRGNASTRHVAVDYFQVWDATMPPSLRQVKLVAASNGNLYIGNKDDGLTIATAGTGVLSVGRWPHSIEAFQKIYLCDGYFANYGRLNPVTNTWDDWGAAVTAHIAGTELPRGTTDNTHGCRYGTLYRGRIILWGLYEEPQNWFMSAAGQPLDWDYAPAATSATMAVAGNNSDAGELGDVIIACAPYSDDLMLMGGDHTLWIMRGDPAAGGVIDSISYQTGIASPGAYAWDPDGVIYFVGAGQLWRMAGGNSQPESISQRRLDKTFQEIDLAVYRVELIWDRQRQGLHIFLIPTSEPAADAAPTHIYWDRRTDSFWKDEYPESMGPTAVHTFDADDPNDRALLLGGWDSYIRYVNDGQKSDDGTAIGSYVYYTPIMPWGPLVEGRMIELKATLSIDSDPVQIYVSGGPSADYVSLESPTKYSRALLPGQNPTMRQRVNGTAFQVRLFGRGKTDETWAIETLTGIFKSGGRSRRRGLI